MRRIYDIARPVSCGTPVWPGDPAMQVGWVALIRDGAQTNLSRVSMGMHTGTHADAPFHVQASGARVGELPLEPFIGRAVLVELGGAQTIDAGFAAAVLGEHPALERVLVRTGAWVDEAFPSRFPGFQPAAVQLFAEAGVVLIGTDAPSVDEADAETLDGHLALTAAGIAILENLALDGIPAGEYELIALPLKLMELDGSPVRAILREL